jgi:hypothetical protein
MDEPLNSLEALWENLLSRQAERVQGAFATLDGEERQVVLAHLRAMATEPGWQPEQSLSAQEALKFLEI